MNAHVEIYTDGACEPNPGLGGWAAVLLYKGRCKVIYGGTRDTTNNRMEMFGAIQGLRALTKPVQVTIYTDSQYLSNGASSWVKTWIKKGKLEKKKNPDLWRVLNDLQSLHQVEWKWVKGHNGNQYNELADQYAGVGRRTQVACAQEWLA